MLLLFSRSVRSDSLGSHGLQHARVSCPSLSLRVCSMSVELVMPSNHLILCRLLLLLPSIFPSIRVFSSKLALCTRWPKYWNFGFSISPSSEYSGLFCFRIDWFALLAVQELHPWHEAFAFMVAGTCRSGIYFRKEGGAVERLYSGEEYPSPS